jgi:hypothetical protein
VRCEGRGNLSACFLALATSRAGPKQAPRASCPIVLETHMICPRSANATRRHAAAGTGGACAMVSPLGAERGAQ